MTAGEWKVALATFGIVFLAELGDKTQLAALALTARSGSPLIVFLGAASALVFVTALGVIAGALLGSWIPPKAVSILSALIFIAVGVFMLIKSIWFADPPGAA